MRCANFVCVVHGELEFLLAGVGGMVLTTSAKQKILAELFRITKSNGQLFIADFGRSDSWHQRLLFNMIRGFDGYTPTKANANGLMLPLISDAGFVNPSIKKKFKTIFGEVQIFKAIKQ